MTITAFALIIAAYLLGSISSAIIVCRFYGKPDPRSSGSNNPGATNVKRLHGTKLAALTLLGDMLKGILPVMLARALGVDDLTLSLVGLGAVIGHIYPIFFGFKGGKAVATSFGVYAVLCWPAALVLLAVWLLVTYVFKISSLSALVASIIAPLSFYFFTGSASITAVVIVITLLILYKHADNIKRLLAGTED